MGSFIIYMTGVMSACIAFALFMDGTEEEAPEEVEPGITVNTPLGKIFEVYCQNCRKIKRHREIEERLLECMKCKRRIDIRKVS